MVHAPEPARTERPCNAQGIEKRPQNCAFSDGAKLAIH